MQQPDRGERISVECPDCDQWVVLIPAVSAKQAAIRAMDIAYPGASDQLSEVKVFTNSCSCGAQVTLTLTRSREVVTHAQA